MVGLYCRVSTDEQAQQGFSIENQKERLVAYCLSQGWDEHRFYIDDGYTGTNTDRPALQRLIQHVKEGKIKTVLVYKLDRLGRKQLDVLHLLEEVFDKHGAAFKSATEPFDTGTPLGKAMLGILAVFAQLERDTIVERTTIGRRQRIRSGLWYGGREPFGYRWNKEAQTLEVVLEEAELVREIFKRFLQGQSYNAINDWVMTRAASRTRSFNHATIRDIVIRPIYAGKMNVNGELVDGNHEAIVSMETYEMAQKEKEKRTDGRAPIGTYLLSGLLECSICGGPVIHIISNSKRNGKTYSYEYYACKAQHVRPKGSTQPMCSLGYFKRAELDQYVVNYLKKLSLNTKVVEKELNSLRANKKTHDKLLADLNNKLKAIDGKLERWYDAFEQGLLNPAQLKLRISTLEEEQKSLQLRLEEADEPVVDRTEDLIGLLKEVGHAWDYMTLEEQQMVLRTAISKIILKPNSKEHSFVWNV